MKPAEKPAFIRLLQQAALRYPNARFAPENAEAYWEDLRDLSFDLIESALAQCRAEMDRNSGDFFPSVPRIRTKALDLMLIAMNIPTPPEAWAIFKRGGYVITAGRQCETYRRMEAAYHKARREFEAWPLDDRDGRENARQKAAGLTAELMMHAQRCDACQPNGWSEQYENPVVAETVRILGGKDRILTDNEAADRSRFIEAYQQIIARKVREVGMMPAARQFVERTRNEIAAGETPLLAAEQGASEAERRAAFETGEQEFILQQERALASRLSAVSGGRS